MTTPSDRIGTIVSMSKIKEYYRNGASMTSIVAGSMGLIPDTVAAPIITSCFVKKFNGICLLNARRSGIMRLKSVCITCLTNATEIERCRADLRNRSIDHH